MRAFLFLIGSSAALISLSTTSCFSSSCDDLGTCNGASDGGGTDGGGETSVIDGGGMDVTPPGCDAGADPKDSPACVASSVGIFVSAAAADDTGDGTKEHPVKTIATALGKTSAAKSRIYICEGMYAEKVSLTAPVAPSLYGGFDCASWSYATKSVKVRPAAGYPLRIDGVEGATSVEDIEFDAAAGTQTAPNSIAAFVTNSPSVRLVRATLSAGAGFVGTDGVTGSNYDAAVLPDDARIVGNDASNTAGGAPHVCSLCTNAVNSTGGSGGAGTAAPTDGQNGTPGVVGSIPPNNGAKGTAAVGVTACTNGSSGAASPVGGDGTGSTKLGTLTVAGWTSEPGTKGTTGGVGQGGGGGGGGISATKGGGGGGGCGGCGGSGAAASTGGGASVGLVALDSPTTLVGCTISTQKAGDGGKGVVGQLGEAGGTTGQNSVPGCPGGAGGKGGDGGASGGGAGGISIGVLYKGAKAPAIDSATTAAITLGNAGAAGAGGKTPALDGKPGVKAAVQDATLL